ncbi:twin-arginine translocation protein, TatA/E family subunit [Beutenbergia cavernae DSM 12333]|uniref:Sec-independent protein translocase protein TatA n=1 Tax=Beutenbergia cavernae (strain ATCC BAA-8 / DSM 12333 / CCUG 43141 / JCM 11478 / NBRC 16432 / NCIMB 13614 / HKI 0122) TaxID=471853 RepID=C5C6A9_BEUC1|nr:Sec-independent protein translocase subunit TatA [Beutenbergia cavernae]ACQ80315.1 twin-arginine translocation protein, TatA/E family subunit [Beutenbergia cavernae DSM 12333]
MRIQPWHILVLVVVILLVFGASRLPNIARNVGKSMKIMKEEVKDLREDGTDPNAEAAEDPDNPEASATNPPASPPQVAPRPASPPPVSTDAPGVPSPTTQYDPRSSDRTA